ncbi:MAG: carboxypeptidase-like regulatory domain-containing protein, partial [Bacteroidales bacterium]|nr:carboxypeptidase-like regulatory domain-containing protein [Bacteroidales bacterium]
MKQKLFIPILILIISSIQLFGQGIEGKVVDSEGQAVPYCSIFIKELTRGTTSNSLGLFSLPLPAGEYNIFFRSLGYSEVAK